MGAATKYETDFYGWTQEQAAALKSGHLDKIDREYIAEELESIGASERRELESRLVVLLLHLLKWQFQPDRRGKSWAFSINEQRRKIPKHLQQNPSLKSLLDSLVESAYEDATYLAEAETSLHRNLFPLDCPWSFEQMLDAEFWPETDRLDE